MYEKKTECNQIIQINNNTFYLRSDSHDAQTQQNNMTLQ